MELDRRRPIMFASVGLAVLATAYSTLKPPRHSDSARETAIEVLIVLAVAVVTLLATRRQIASDNAAKPSGWVALVAAVVGLLAIGVFWIGVFSIAIAGGATLIALEARKRGNAPRAAAAAMVVAAATVALSILVAIAS